MQSGIQNEESMICSEDDILFNYFVSLSEVGGEGASVGVCERERT